MLTLFMGWQITYYSENVRKIIDSWPVGIRAFYARLTERIKLYGPNLGMPFTLGNKILLHAFIKKTKKTPQKELKIARQRLKEVRHENP